MRTDCCCWDLCDRKTWWRALALLSCLWCADMMDWGEGTSWPEGAWDESEVVGVAFSTLSFVRVFCATDLLAWSFSHPWKLCTCCASCACTKGKRRLVLRRCFPPLVVRLCSLAFRTHPSRLSGTEEYI